MSPNCRKNFFHFFPIVIFILLILIFLVFQFSLPEFAFVVLIEGMSYENFFLRIVISSALLDSVDFFRDVSVLELFQLIHLSDVLIRVLKYIRHLNSDLSHVDFLMLRAGLRVVVIPVDLLPVRKLIIRAFVRV